jgi:crossover junction endodeoxyribonuclease RuvC
MPRILGIDPGSRITGFGILDTDGRSSQHVASGALRVPDDDLAGRLGYIFEEISALLRAHAPQEVAVENVFVSRNAASALKLGQARGAAISACAVAGVSVAEYSPREVKLAIVGTGGADKAQVQHMVRALLGLREELQADRADALAVALCHAHSRSTLGRLQRQLARGTP